MTTTAQKAPEVKTGTYRKVEIVEAVKYEGAPLTVIHDQLGEQQARRGDWLLGTERGKIRVITAKQFAAEYEPYTTTPAEAKALAAAKAADDETDEPIPAAAGLKETKASKAEAAAEEKAPLRKQPADEDVTPLREHPVSSQIGKKK